MISSKTKIGLLVAGHVVAGLLLAWANMTYGSGNPSPELGGLIAFVFAQVGLLGIWGALGTAQWTWRLPSASAMTGYLCALAITAERRWHIGHVVVEFCLYIAVPAVVVFLVLCILRHGRCKLHFARPSLPSAWGDQFTIRHLLLATAAVATVLTIGRELRTISQGDLIEAILCITICRTAIDFAVLWGTLGIKRPTLRLTIVVPSAFIVGMIPPYFEATTVRIDWQDYVFWSCIMGFQAMIMVASLLLVRSCGWRLVRGTVEKRESLPTPPGS